MLVLAATNGTAARGDDYTAACPGERRPAAITPLPVENTLDPARVELGRLLFRDPRLSGDGTVSCASCHVISEGGADGRPRSPGVAGRVGEINAPSVLNRVFDFRQFWDGRAESLIAQIEGPLHHPKEMDSSWEHVLAVLEADPGFADGFRAAYPDGLSAANVRDAIATFEAALITPNAAFDRWLCGDDDALSPTALHGYRSFQDYGCISCHQGRNVGGNMYQRLGVVDDYFDGSRPIEKADLGRFNVTGDERDRYVFKVPSLRNVELTAPYFHDASQETLPEAVRTMARVQLGRRLPEDDVDAIVAFLRSLTGDLPGARR
jgi:cytochrome c peroxidase